MRPVPVGIHLPCAGQEPAVKRALLLLSSLLAMLAGCARLPGPAPPPPYRGQIEDHPAHYVHLRDAVATRHAIGGIGREIHDGWRWAGRRAELRFAVEESQGIQFEVTLIVPHEFVQAGGRRIEVWIGGKLLGAIAADQAGYQAWKQPVPEQWLTPGANIEAVLLADADYSQGGEKLSYMLIGAGFTL